MPAASEFSERLLIGRPVVQRGRIKVRSVRPHESFNLRVNPHLVEYFEVAQWTVHLAGQDRPKIDSLFCIVIKKNTKCVRTHNLERANSINRMIHKYLFQRFDGHWALPLLQAFPVRSQINLMQLGPCLHQAFLPPRQGTGDQVYRINAEDADLALAVSVEVGRVMRRTRFRKHANNNSEKPAELRHSFILFYIAALPVAASAICGLTSADWLSVLDDRYEPLPLRQPAR